MQTSDRILVTGARGFLGKKLIPLLEETSATILPLTSADCDLTDLSATKKFLNENPVNTIIHAAGLVLSRSEQQKRPAEVLFNNLMTNLVIAEAAQSTGVKRIIFISSVTAYPSAANAPFQTEDLWSGPVTDGNYAYGTAKRMADIIARAYTEQYGIATTVLLLPNIYGPGDKFSYNPPPLIPNCIQQVLAAKENNTPHINGGNNGDVLLDLLYVEDAARAIIKVLKTENLPRLINIGSQQAVSIKAIYSTVAEIVGYQNPIIWDSNSATPLPRLMNTTTATERLGWQASTTLRDGLEATIKAYLRSR